MPLFARLGVMRISDFPLIFNDEEFPIHWKKEYIRLLTTFEVAVELGNGELLIPSALNPDKPNLPQTMFPEDMVSNYTTLWHSTSYVYTEIFLLLALAIAKSMKCYEYHCL